MFNAKDYINSGILEMYVLGIASDEQCKEVEEMAETHKEIRDEIERISGDIESYASMYAIKPSPTIKPFLMATIDYSERLKNGEPLSFPPQLNKNSKISDFKEWISRKDMVLPSNFEGLFAKIIAYTPQMTTAIVWIKEMAPDEVHDNEHERFLILEGECDITVGNETRHFKPGDFFQVPLHKTHKVVVTSEIPCKIILQREAA